MTSPRLALRELRVSRPARDRYRFDDALFATRGDIVFADLGASRRLAQRMNEVRASRGDSTEPAHAAEVEAMGLMHEALHLLIAAYRRANDARALDAALAAVAARIGPDELARTLHAFSDAYPAASVYRGEESPERYLEGRSDDLSHRELALEELLLVWVANENPALARYGELFDDEGLERTTRYRDVLEEVRRFYADEATGADGEEDLVSMLLAPARAAPDSVAEQLRYIGERWGYALGGLRERLVRGLDVLAEDERARWLRSHPGGAGDPDSSALHAFADDADESERFSPDRDWMPSLVLLAKSTYVWLDQLSRAHGRPIRTLDGIPDEELDRLAARGFTGLWLIGLWERSHASQRIKQLRGNPDAVASAYSLRDYRIADDLGGEEAYRDLRDRAWARGIRLASDMVPNHMGIDSRWVVDHPEWFISRPDSPYPSYTFTGPNLSNDERVAIHLEDHYYDGSDAAVVFKRQDRWSGEERYVYHGNDGTSFPWNDTAQIDYLSRDAREAVMGAILDVCRRFPIIRFDAAMVLAKKHVQRLWYPEPGSGGAIPSRAEYAMPKAEFDRLMPAEFWREVVDRVAAEAPDTLLLAEAFWLMEGYFVRTLGMHRVYNSAFMNMLRDERNAEYRAVIKNTLAFDPEILKRYVNFMNNPDERTAIDQFGSGDKYFGVATLMTTMPGVPMFGHGQVEGLTEKYGMEFRRARIDEMPDEELVARHEHEIFPLLHRRHEFAQADDFQLYDFIDDDGVVNEDVFAYSNRSGGGRSLVVFNDRYAEASGTIRVSVPASVRTADGERALVTRTLAEGLGLDGDAVTWLVLRDARTGREHLRDAREIAERGLHLTLGAYGCHVFADLREIRDDGSGSLGRLADRLGGGSTHSVEEALEELATEQVRDAVAAAFAPDVVRAVGEGADLERVAERVRAAADVLAEAGAGQPPGPADERAAAKAPADASAAAAVRTLDRARALPVDRRGPLASGDPVAWGVTTAWAVLDALGGASPPGDRRSGWTDRWGVEGAVANTLRELGADDARADRGAAVVRSLLDLPEDALSVAAAATGLLPSAWLADGATARAVGLNEHRGVRYVDRDGYVGLLRWLALRDELREPPSRAATSPRAGADASATIVSLARRAEDAGYVVTHAPDEAGERDRPAAPGPPARVSAAAGSGPAETTEPHP